MELLAIGKREIISQVTHFLPLRSFRASVSISEKKSRKNIHPDEIHLFIKRRS